MLLLTATHAFSQEAADSTLFDFWVGKWDATWKNADGSTGQGTNTIVKILDGKVLQENFVDSSPGGLKGTSLSIYNPTTHVWHQTWADNQNGYIVLEGGVENGKKYFRTRMKEQGGKKTLQRMVFYDIKPGSFTWDWENSADGGQTWTLLWKIRYTKAAQ